MNEEQALAEIKLAIMRTLRVISAPLLLPDTTLRAHIDIALPARIPDDTYNEATSALKKRGYITCTPQKSRRHQNQSPAQNERHRTPLDHRQRTHRHHHTLTHRLP